jgi:hypothetical protein
MPRTKYYVKDTVALNLKGTVDIEQGDNDLKVGETSFSIRTSPTPSPFDDLQLVIKVDTQKSALDGTYNSKEKVTVSPSTITFKSWAETDSFKISIAADWDVTLVQQDFDL